MAGKLYRSKVPTQPPTTILTLSSGNRCWVKTATATASAEELIEVSGEFEQILGKLTLMFAPRQNYAIEGVCWDGLVRLGNVSFGGEAERVLLEVRTLSVWID